MNEAECFMRMELGELAQWCGINADPGSNTASVAEPVLRARLASASAEAAAAAATQTKRLVLATWVLAVATIVAAIVAS
jgi:hypothetical protein